MPTVIKKIKAMSKDPTEGSLTYRNIERLNGVLVPDKGGLKEFLNQVKCVKLKEFKRMPKEN